MVSKVYFFSFANTVYLPSLRRLQSQIRECKLINESYFFTNKDLDENFKKDFHPYIYRRGYGYWKWKSYLAQKMLNQLDEGDILIYADAGCDFNPEASQRLQEYIDMVRNCQSGILAFEDSYLESTYTKGDVFDFLITNKEERERIANSKQILCTIWLIRKNTHSCQMIDNWKNISTNHYLLTTDKTSSSPNYSDFIEARHDQSVFSILSKLYKATAISCEEMKKENYPYLPLQPTRHKQKTLWTDLRRKLLLPYRYLVGLYLVKVKGFYFHNRIAW